MPFGGTLITIRTGKARSASAMIALGFPRIGLRCVVEQIALSSSSGSSASPKSLLADQRTCGNSGAAPLHSAMLPVKVGEWPLRRKYVGHQYPSEGPKSALGRSSSRRLAASGFAPLRTFTAARGTGRAGFGYAPFSICPAYDADLEKQTFTHRRRG